MTKNQCKAVAMALAQRRQRVYVVTGDSFPADMKNKVTQWKASKYGSRSILVTTSVGEVGISNDNCTFLIVYGGAYSLVSLVQAFGRVGRQG